MLPGGGGAGEGGESRRVAMAHSLPLVNSIPPIHLSSAYLVPDVVLGTGDPGMARMQERARER